MSLSSRCRPGFGFVVATFWLLTTLLAESAAHADEMSSTYQLLEQHPQDVALNLKYAAIAERAGKLKWALPAYERALIADPANQAARLGIDRVRAGLQREAGESQPSNDRPPF